MSSTSGAYMGGGKKRKYQKKNYGGTKVEKTYVSRPIGANLRTERKYFNSYKNRWNVSSSGASWALSGADPAGGIDTLFYPTQGAATNQRIGRRVDVVKIQIRGVLHYLAQSGVPAAGFNQDLTRLILYVDMQTNGLPSDPSALVATPAVASNDLNMCQLQEVNNFGKFRVLKDKTMVPGGPPVYYDGANWVTGIRHVPFHFTVSFKKAPVRVNFTGNTGTVADIIDNSFHLAATTLNGQTDLSYQCRVVFVDV